MVDPRFFVPPRIPVTHRNPPPMNACRLGALLWVKRQRRRVPCTGRMQCFIDYYLHCHVIADRSSPSVHTGVPAISTACRPGLAWPGLAYLPCTLCPVRSHVTSTERAIKSNAQRKIELFSSVQFSAVHWAL